MNQLSLLATGPTKPALHQLSKAHANTAERMLFPGLKNALLESGKDPDALILRSAELQKGREVALRFVDKDGGHFTVLMGFFLGIRAVERKRPHLHGNLDIAVSDSHPLPGISLRISAKNFFMPFEKCEDIYPDGKPRPIFWNIEEADKGTEYSLKIRCMDRAIRYARQSEIALSAGVFLEHWRSHIADATTAFRQNCRRCGLVDSLKWAADEPAPVATEYDKTLDLFALSAYLPPSFVFAYGDGQ